MLQSTRGLRDACHRGILASFLQQSLSKWTSEAPSTRFSTQDGKRQVQDPALMLRSPLAR